MREIKFRAWAEKTTNNRWNYAYQKAKEEYLDKLSNLNMDELDADFTEEEIREKYFAEFDALNIEPKTLSKEMISDITVNGEKVVRPYGYEILDVMQYTGLKDKNGKEIYEGDVVKNFYGKVAVVIYLDGGFKLFTNTTEFKPVSVAIGPETECNSLGQYFPHNIEVIGNIYENPELLNL